MSTIALAATLLLQVQVFAPSTPQAPARPQAPAAAQVTAPGETAAEPEVIQTCRMVAVTGTRFPRRVCRSARQNRADTEESQDMLRNGQGLPGLDASSNSPKGSGSAGPL